jgi:hypothetical protein
MDSTASEQRHRDFLEEFKNTRASLKKGISLFTNKGKVAPVLFMEAYREVDLWLRSFLISALDETKVRLSRLCINQQLIFRQPPAISE